MRSELSPRESTGRSPRVGRKGHGGGEGWQCTTRQTNTAVTGSRRVYDQGNMSSKPVGYAERRVQPLAEAGDDHKPVNTIGGRLHNVTNVDTERGGGPVFEG